MIAALAVLAAVATATQAGAETYPDRPIRLVIPFSPGGPNDLIARPLTEKMGFMSAVLAVPNVKSGLLRLLATTGRERAPSLPDAPTFQEAGFREMDVTGYFGLWFPARTPRERVDLIHREAVKALNSPLVQKIIADSGLHAVGSGPAEFADFVQKDFEWQKAIVQRIGMQVE